jgi:hypothetical protein
MTTCTPGSARTNSSEFDPARFDIDDANRRLGNASLGGHIH